MTPQEKLNIFLIILPIAIPLVQFLLTKYFSKDKDRAEYSGDLLELMNKTTEALKKAREDLTASEDAHEQTVEAMRTSHDAALEAVRLQLNSRIDRQKARIEELEKVQKIYSITFDLVTHPNIELRNAQVKAMDDVSASQKIKSITEADLKDHLKKE